MEKSLRRSYHLQELIGGNFLPEFSLGNEEMKERLAALCEDFHELMSFMGKCEKESVAKKACVWAQAFVGMGWRPTPYIQ